METARSRRDWGAVGWLRAVGMPPRVVSAEVQVVVVDQGGVHSTLMGLRCRHRGAEIGEEAREGAWVRVVVAL